MEGISIDILVECNECGCGLGADYENGLIIVAPCHNCIGNLETKIWEACNLYPDLRDSVFKGVLKE